MNIFSPPTLLTSGYSSLSGFPLLLPVVACIVSLFGSIHLSLYVSFYPSFQTPFVTVVDGGGGDRVSYG
jgi:hypothetical protein